MSGSSVSSSALPWPAGTATGMGSVPGRDIAEATKVIFGELCDFPHIPELPARGPGADIVGRAVALLVDLPAEIYAGQWRMADRPGADLRMARDYLRWDLDALTDQASDWSGCFKLQVAGPWTLASTLALPMGGPVLGDPGAVRDLVASLAEGVLVHVRAVQARMPAARIVLQLDEPALPAVIEGRIPTESGLGRLRPVDRTTARGGLASVIEAAGVPAIVHCCAPSAPLRLFREAGAVGVALDMSVLDDLDSLGELLDGGMGLVAGAVDTRQWNSRDPENRVEAVAARVRRLWEVLALPRSDLSCRVVVSPACGLSGLPADDVRQVLSMCRESARRLVEDGR